jgi:hypothetical protein
VQFPCHRRTADMHDFTVSRQGGNWRRFSKRRPIQQRAARSDLLSLSEHADHGRSGLTRGKIRQRTSGAVLENRPRICSGLKCRAGQLAGNLDARGDDDAHLSFGGGSVDHPIPTAPACTTLIEVAREESATKGSVAQPSIAAQRQRATHFAIDLRAIDVRQSLRGIRTLPAYWFLTSLAIAFSVGSNQLFTIRLRSESR